MVPRERGAIGDFASADDADLGVELEVSIVGLYRDADDDDDDGDDDENGDLKGSAGLPP